MDFGAICEGGAFKAGVGFVPHAGFLAGSEVLIAYYCVFVSFYFR